MKKQFLRFTFDGLLAGTELAPDDGGRLFVGPSGPVDLAGVSLLAATVDTVRQLYIGTLRGPMYGAVLAAVGDFFEYGGYSFICARASYKSGYRYCLQNSELGVIIFLASFYSLDDAEGNHLKFELSPHFVATRPPEEVQNYLDALADCFLSQWSRSGCAVHLALDVQGWAMPADFEERFTTASRVRRAYNGVADVEFTDIDTASVSYGRHVVESLTFGRPGGLQTSIYLKTKEILRHDTVDYFNALWAKHQSFDAKKPVWRIEMRFHHSVIREIGLGMDKEMECYLDASTYLKDIWQYALSKNCLNYSRTYIDPCWQLFMQDADFKTPPYGIEIKRRKKELTGSIDANIKQIIGSVLHLAARQGKDIKFVMVQLRLSFYWPSILSYYQSRGISFNEMRQRFEKRLLFWRLKGAIIIV